jgi:GMP synthase (glutamine-hydrolysing)
MDEEIAVIDFGSPYTQQIIENLRQLGVFCRVYSYKNPPSIAYSNVYIKGIILSDGPHYANNEDSPQFDFDKYKSVPILGICYGAQLIAKHFHGKISTLDKNMSKYPITIEDINEHDDDEEFALLNNIDDFPIKVPLSNCNNVISCADAIPILSSDNLNLAAFQIDGKDIYGLQFHPEMDECQYGKHILQNFCVVANAKFNWEPENILSIVSKEMRDIIFAPEIVKKETRKNDDYVPRIAMAISGGLNSTVTGYLLQTIVGKFNFYPILIDNGFMRQGEIQDIQKIYQDLGFHNLRIIDAKQHFLKVLKNVTNPQEKQIKIGKVFVKLFHDEVLKIEKELRKSLKKRSTKKRLIQYISQGTIYSDIMDIVHVERNERIESSLFKYNHNISTLEKRLNVITLEPLKMLVKSDVKTIGFGFGLLDTILERQPFPAPGLAIRIVGSVNNENVKLLREVDYTATKYMSKYGYYQTCWQFAVIMLANVTQPDIHGDLKINKTTFVIRSINSIDGVNAVIHDIPVGILEGLANHLCDKIPQVGRILFDVTPKPPATIEWD